jgi:hypothetical protein
MDEQVTAVGEKIRLFFRQLFGSRMASHLEDELFQIRADYEVRLKERAHYIADLKEEKQVLQRKVAEYEMVLLPLTQGGILGPKRPAPVFEDVLPVNSWKAEQDAYYKQQEEEVAEEPSV